MASQTFVFGDGHVFIGNIEIEGLKGLVISSSEIKHEINDKNPEWADKTKQYTPKEDDVLIMSSSLDGARVLQDMVNAHCLLMNGYKVED